MPRTLRMILNTFYSGPQAWFFLAADRGYFAEAGIDVSFAEGDTAANAVPKVASGGYDVGYGDMNALIEHRAARADRPSSDDPVGVFATFNASPYTIAVPAAQPIRSPSELHDTILASHPNDAALRMFPVLAAQSGLDLAHIKIEICAAPHPAMVYSLIAQSRWTGMFGFVNTLRAAAIEAGYEPSQLRFLEYRDYVPELYGAVVLVARRLIENEPEIVRGFVHAINRALRDTIEDLDAAIDAVARRNPGIDRRANRERLQGTLQLEMSHADGARLGIGAVDYARLAQAIDRLTTALRLPRHPDARDVFDDRFLPALDERVPSLARAKREPQS